MRWGLSLVLAISIGCPGKEGDTDSGSEADSDTDTQLSASEVEGYITDSAIDLAIGSSVGVSAC